MKFVLTLLGYGIGYAALRYADAPEWGAILGGLVMGSRLSEDSPKEKK